MKFQLITALLAGVATAAPASSLVTDSSVEAVELSKRVVDPVSIAIIGGVVSGIVGASATQALNFAKDASDWNAVSHTLPRSYPYS
jgi:hypothetical protein